ncbi:MAG TPA: peptidoglycan-binding domain-containing protein [Clostridiaceae bacterium]
MKNKKLLSVVLSISILLSGTFFVNLNVKADSIGKTITVIHNNLSVSQESTGTLGSDRNLKPLKFALAKGKLFPEMYSSTMSTFSNSTLAAALYTAPYSIVHTSLGDALFLQQGCTDTNSRAFGWDHALQTDLNNLSQSFGLGINLTVDGEFGPGTTSGVKTFQTYVRNSWGCSSMSIDGVAGNQTWTAIYALFSGYNPHSYIS